MAGAATMAAGAGFISLRRDWKVIFVGKVFGPNLSRRQTAAFHALMNDSFSLEKLYFWTHVLFAKAQIQR